MRFPSVGLGRCASLVFVSALAVAPGAFAATGFSSRPVYLTASGPATVTENFSGYAVDTGFQTTPVAVGGYTLQQTGPGTFRNLIDASPLTYDDNNGTTNASCFTDLTGNAATEVGVLISFPTPVRAFGGDFYGVEGALAGGGTPAEGLQALVFNGGTQIGTFVVPDQAGFGGQFFGVIAGAGEQITSIRLASRTSIANGGEGFGLDDTTVTIVPEPASVGLAALAAAALGRRVSRPRRAR